MKTIHILTNNSCPNSVAFNSPLFAAKKYFNEKNYSLKFFTKVSKNIFASDVIFINSNVFRTYWKDRKEEIFSFLKNSKEAKQKIIWFDTTDSTWCTQFEVMPYVNKFLKGQLLKDKSQYLTPFRTGRIFTDTFDKLYNSKESEFTSSPLEKKYIDKMAISWNTCFENYSETRYSYKNKVRRKITDYILNHISTPFNIKFSPTNNDRNNQLSCRVGLSHSRQSVIDHRIAINNILKKRYVQTTKVTLPKYFNELRNSQIGVGPFGVGEITLRDFEIIICGALLLKPDMSHMETWPNLFVNNETCITHKWDLSDFDEEIDYILANKKPSIEIANNAQKVYQHALSDDGMKEFTERLLRYT